MKHTKNLLKIIKNAGKIILKANSIEDNTKMKTGTSDFVTKYDVAIQEYIINKILKIIPNAKFIAEEQKNDQSVLESDYCFIIDPIDGTANFIHNLNLSAISVALFSKSELIFGSIYHPYSGDMFYAEKGKGAFLNEKPIHVSSRTLNIGICLFGTSPYYKEKCTDKTFNLCKDVFMLGGDVRRLGAAALDLAYVAAGRGDAFFEFILQPWDCAAGILLIREAGGIISQMDGSDFDFTKPVSVIATNKENYPTLLTLSKKYV